MGWKLLWAVPTAPGWLEQVWGQGTQSICICHFVYCFYLQEELKQKLKGVFLSPLNMNHSSKTNLTIEISKVRGSSNNPRAKAGGRGGCSRHRTYALLWFTCSVPPPRKASTRTLLWGYPPNIGKCFNPKLKVKKKKKKNKTKIHKPHKPPSHNHHP